jgi:hypothetical protein
MAIIENEELEKEQNNAAGKMVAYNISNAADLLSTCSVAIRYFQVSAALIFLQFLIGFIVIWILSPERFIEVVNGLFQNVFAAPQSTIGFLSNLSALITLFGPFLLILLTASLGNIERLGFWIAFLLVLAMIIGASILYYQYFELLSVYGTAFVFLTLGTLVISNILLGHIGYGLFKGIRANRLDIANIKVNSKGRFFVDPIRNTFAIPQFVSRLGIRSIPVSILFIMSSLALANAILPFVSPVTQAKNIFQLNRAISMMSPSSLRLEHFQTSLREDMLLLPIYIFLGFILWYVIYRMLLYAAQKLSITSLESLIRRDPRSPVVFFRSFSDEQVRLPSPKMNVISKMMRIGTSLKTLDNLILTELSEAGPVVALGDPSNPKIPYGAARSYLENKDWQTSAFQLIDDARHIVLVFGDTPSVWEEFEAILDKNREDQTLFVLPPQSDEVRQKFFVRACEKFKNFPLGESTTPIHSPIGFFLRNESLEVIVAEKPTEDHYLTMIRRFYQTKNQKTKRQSKRIKSPYAVVLLGFVFILFAWRFVPSFDNSMRYESETTGIVDIIGAANDENQPRFIESDVVDIKSQPNGEGIIAYLRTRKRPPEVIWFSEKWEVEHIGRVTVSAPVQNITPAFTRNDLLIVGEDGRVYVEAYARYIGNVFASNSAKSRWILTCFTEDGEKVWSATSKSEDNDTAKGIADKGNGSVYLIKQNELIVIDPNGQEKESIQVHTSQDINDKIFVLDNGLIWYDDSLKKQINSVFQKMSWDGKVEWRFEINSNLGSPTVRFINTKGYLFGANDYDFDNEREGDRGYVGLISQEGKLKWMTKIPIEDATLEDVTYTDSAIYAVLSSGSSYGVDARTFVVSLSYEGEILKTYETPKGLSREPEGIMVSSSGDVFVYGTAKNVPLRATRLEALLQPDEAWVAKVILEK